MSGGAASVEAAFAALWRALAAMPDAAERRVARDAVRDALDRNAPRLDERTPCASGRFLADSFTIEEKLAEGGSAEVFRARHRDLGTLHALKILKPDHASDPVRRGLFLDEAANHLRVRHPAVTQAQMLLRTSDNRPALVLGLASGATLSFLVGMRPFGQAAAFVLMRRLGRALGAVHAAGLVHGDLSPANVIVPDGAFGKALLCDFGLSRLEGERYHGIAMAGTAPFAAPEQAHGSRPLDRRTDVFALGALVRWLMPNATDRFGALLAAMTQTAPARRPPDVAAVLDALDAAECGLAATDGRETTGR